MILASSVLPVIYIKLLFIFNFYVYKYLPACICVLHDVHRQAGRPGTSLPLHQVMLIALVSQPRLRMGHATVGTCHQTHRWRLHCEPLDSQPITKHAFAIQVFAWQLFSISVNVHISSFNIYLTKESVCND